MKRKRRDPGGGSLWPPSPLLSFPPCYLFCSASMFLFQSSIQSSTLALAASHPCQGQHGGEAGEQQNTTAHLPALKPIEL